MTKTFALTVALICVSLPLFAQEPTWTKVLKDRKKRTALIDASQTVRGDSGKWRDDPQLLYAPKRPPKTVLDAWADFVEKKKPKLTGSGDTWLIYRTKQLNDNDRLWIERIERKGNQFTVVASQAKWKGKYFRNFTQYYVVGVNLGKLPAGKYQAKWIVRPMEFLKFDGDAKAKGNWPKDERAVKAKPLELRVGFVVGG